MTGEWQRTRYRNNFANVALNTFGQNQFGVANQVIQRSEQIMDPWMIQANLFIPVLPTYSNNLAGTASISAQWFVGQGLNAFGYSRDNDASWFKFSGAGLSGNGAGGFNRSNFYDKVLMSTHGGYVQGQYWFTNQWFVNAVWATNVTSASTVASPPSWPARPATRRAISMQQQRPDQDLAGNRSLLVLRPIEAFKFGLQYAYTRTDWLQKQNNPNNPGFVQAQGQPSAGAKDIGEAHRVEFVAYMFLLNLKAIDFTKPTG